MEENTPPPIDDLVKKINQLSQKQELLANEITDLKKVIYQTKQLGSADQTVDVAFPKIEKVGTAKEILPAPPISKEQLPRVEVILPKPAPIKIKKENKQWEEFIGTNLLNKIGIAILVLGISYGVKYSIDHELINPITRIILGYLAGAILIGLAIKLKAEYKTFSAVLLSGGMAAFYFITFAAYDLYNLMPQAMAFIMMVLFTAFTVYAALQYDQKAIAIIGLVGAYGVPFLLSDGSGRVVILFSYITIVNVGILLLAFRKAWKQLYYLAFALTWLSYSVWFLDRYSYEQHLWISLIFSAIFFATFYITFLAYKLVQSEPLSRWDVVLLMLNSFLYFGFGYAAIVDHPSGELFLGLFTLFNAILHFVACLVIFKSQSHTKDVFYFVAGMVLVFITLAVPVELEGNWVTLIWAGEAALLFWIGRTKSFPVYERLSYILILLAVGSLLDDWEAYGSYTSYNKEYFIRLFLNINFASSLLVVSSLSWILKLSLDKQFVAPAGRLQPAFTWILSGILFVILYFAFFKEIENYWVQRYADSSVMMRTSDPNNDYPVYDSDIHQFRSLWLLIYSGLFGVALSFLNQKVLKNKYITIVAVVFNVLVLFAFAFGGLASLSDLRNSFINQTDAELYFRDWGHILIRYGCFLAILPLVWFNRQFIKDDLFDPTIKKVEIALFHIFTLIILSSELIHWLELAHVHESFKLGLSILWGAYALILIVRGLKLNNKYLRVMAIVLFAITLLKLFIYDMADMSTIAKTIVMMILGILLLTASFIYNKAKKATDLKTDEENATTNEKPN